MSEADDLRAEVSRLEADLAQGRGAFAAVQKQRDQLQAQVGHLSGYASSSRKAPTQNEHGDWMCQHGTAMDVHCCNCHSGFQFDQHECPDVVDDLGPELTPDQLADLNADFNKFVAARQQRDHDAAEAVSLRAEVSRLKQQLFDVGEALDGEFPSTEPCVARAVQQQRVALDKYLDQVGRLTAEVSRLQTEREELKRELCELGFVLEGVASAVIGSASDFQESFPIVLQVADLKALVDALTIQHQELQRTMTQHEEQLIDQRVIGHGEGQEHVLRDAAFCEAHQPPFVSCSCCEAVEADDRRKQAEAQLQDALTARAPLELNAAVLFLEALQEQHIYLHDGHGNALSRDEFISAVTHALATLLPAPAHQEDEEKKETKPLTRAWETATPPTAAVPQPPTR